MFEYLNSLVIDGERVNLVGAVQNPVWEADVTPIAVDHDIADYTRFVGDPDSPPPVDQGIWVYTVEFTKRFKQSKLRDKPPRVNVPHETLGTTRDVVSAELTTPPALTIQGERYTMSFTVTYRVIGEVSNGAS